MVSIIWPCGLVGVSPCVLERAGAGTGPFDGFEDVEQIARGAGQALQTRDHEHVTRLEAVRSPRAGLKVIEVPMCRE
jgi:hypothetical protein